jgi:hypothetical protein
MNQFSQQSTKATVIGLSYTGLLPFIFFVTWALLYKINYIPLLLFCYYSNAILIFLAGSLWRHENQSRMLLIQSNLLVLLAVLAITSFHLNPAYCLWLQILGHTWILLLDTKLTDYKTWYKQMRFFLSFIVISLHGLAFYAL